MTPDQVGELLNVSRETIKKFQALFNLAGKMATPDQSCLQQHACRSMAASYSRFGAIGCPLSTQDTQILDVGSGAGFPGLVLAIMGGVTVDLVESDQRKAVFLSTVIRELGLPAKVHNQRIETMPNLRPDVITARALASVPKLLNLIETQLHPDCVCLFLKGASVEDELTNLQSYSTMVATTYPSLSGSTGVVLELKNPR